MAIKTISQFDAATPTSNDKILFEQNGEGKSTTIGNAVNTCSLTLEEIQATTDLSGKIASASALLNSREIKLLGTLTTHNTSYTLAENLNNFRLIMGTLIFNQYSLATTITMPSILIGGEMIVCFYDGTLRKGQFQVGTDGINVYTNINPDNWTGISKILLYGVR